MGLREFIAKLKEEVLEEQGRAEVTSGRPACPKCGRLLETYWGRNSQKWRVVHPRYTCELEFEVFAQDADEKKVREIARQALTGYLVRDKT